ncbi:hypothetical protein AAY473_038046 [Plecturocebus cupreus]
MAVAGRQSLPLSPGWSAAARSRLIATSNSLVQMILLPQPPESFKERAGIGVKKPYKERTEQHMEREEKQQVRKEAKRRHEGRSRASERERGGAVYVEFYLRGPRVIESGPVNGRVIGSEISIQAVVCVSQPALQGPFAPLCFWVLSCYFSIRHPAGVQQIWSLAQKACIWLETWTALTGAPAVWPKSLPHGTESMNKV